LSLATIALFTYRLTLKTGSHFFDSKVAGGVPTMNHWQRLDASQSLNVQGPSRVGHTGLLLSMVQNGVGISRLLDVAARPLVASGQLVTLLQGCFEQDAIAIFA
jgi:DNA-binding transcriptional LysR family regulator